MPARSSRATSSSRGSGDPADLRAGAGEPDFVHSPRAGERAKLAGTGVGTEDARNRIAKGRRVAGRCVSTGDPGLSRLHREGVSLVRDASPVGPGPPSVPLEHIAHTRGPDVVRPDSVDRTEQGCGG